METTKNREKKLHNENLKQYAHFKLWIKFENKDHAVNFYNFYPNTNKSLEKMKNNIIFNNPKKETIEKAILYCNKTNTEIEIIINKKNSTDYE
jgi:hypothetical protein